MSIKVGATDMKQEQKRELKPKLRFPEFRDASEWRITALDSKVTKVGSGITPTGGHKNYKNKGRPFIRSQNVGWGELILDDVAFIDNATHATFLATEIKEGDVLLNITGASIGRSAVADSRIHGGNVNQHVCIIRPIIKELSPELLNQYLLSQYGQKQVDSFQAGGNRQGLNFAQVRSFSIPLPQKIEEQQKIADCLSSIDKLIAAQSQKRDTLKAHKKGLLQQLFPAEGETLPQLRFSEFREKWKENSLGVVSDSISSGKDKSDPNGSYDLYGSTGVIGKTSSGTYNGEFILIARVGANAGFLTRVNGRFGVTDNTLVVCVNKSTNIDFVLHYLENFSLNRLIFGSGQPLITGGQLKALPLFLPNNLEQQKIANCLASIDALIAAQTQKLAMLNGHKKGLMQQLFPSPDEVQG